MRLCVPFLAALALGVGCAGEPAPNRPVPPPVAFSATLSHLTEQEPTLMAYFSDGARVPVSGMRVLTVEQMREQNVRLAVAESPWAGMPEVVEVVACESRHESDAVGDQGRAIGLLQVRTDAHPDLARRYDLFDPAQNLRAGWEIYQRQGWGAWYTCSARAGLR